MWSSYHSLLLPFSAFSWTRGGANGFGQGPSYQVAHPTPAQQREGPLKVQPVQPPSEPSNGDILMRSSPRSYISNPALHHRTTAPPQRLSRPPLELNFSILKLCKRIGRRPLCVPEIDSPAVYPAKPLQKAEPVNLRNQNSFAAAKIPTSAVSSRHTNLNFSLEAHPKLPQTRAREIFPNAQPSSLHPIPWRP